MDHQHQKAILILVVIVLIIVLIILFYVYNTNKLVMKGNNRLLRNEVANNLSPLNSSYSNY